MPLRPAAGKHEPPSPPRQDQRQQHTHTHSPTFTHPYTHTANGSQGASTDSGSSREEDSGVPISAFCPVAERSHSARAPMEEPTGNTVVIRIGIPDLQQTVRARSVATVEERTKEREAASPPSSPTVCLLPLFCVLSGYRFVSAKYLQLYRFLLPI
ncbi:hypothetical protein CesoFtcFv8_007650 [Champsocephalus esox]|uniref:Uncharacterized protein n=1 Tax=Champsocephalus esox TaxID=159716 RepID=A0AAN8H4S1_9TELE|nr:hypothetical protein CesoFtcFv8_007650 [Champsocephalus esox]